SWRPTMGLLSKLFGGKETAPPGAAEPGAAPIPLDPLPDAVVVLRRGMNIPTADYVAHVVSAALPELGPNVPRIGLAQPRWFKSSEIAESAAADAAHAIGLKLGLVSPRHRYRTLDGPDGAQVLLIELHRG